MNGPFSSLPYEQWSMFRFCVLLGNTDAQIAESTGLSADQIADGHASLERIRKSIAEDQDNQESIRLADRVAQTARYWLWRETLGDVLGYAAIAEKLGVSVDVITRFRALVKARATISGGASLRLLDGASQ